MIIQAEGLRKTFRVRRGRSRRGPPAGDGRRAGGVAEAVRGLDLEVAEQEIFGFLGPNGAGKTTVVRILATLLAPDAGCASVAGFDLLAEPARVREQIGYVSQAGGVDTQASGRRNVILQARLSCLDIPQARQRTQELLERFGLASIGDRRAATLSGGQLRRLALVIGLVSRPRLLFLDEPTLGLDPQIRVELWREIRQLQTAGTTVFLTTHYLEEADALCDRVAIIDEGLIVAVGTPDELKRQVAGDIVSLHIDDTQAAVACLRDMPGVREVHVDDSMVRAYVADGERAVPGLLRRLDDNRLRVESIAMHRPSLDDVFLFRTGHPLALEASGRSMPTRPSR